MVFALIWSNACWLPTAKGDRPAATEAWNWRTFFWIWPNSWSLLRCPRSHRRRAGTTSSCSAALVDSRSRCRAARPAAAGGHAAIGEFAAGLEPASSVTAGVTCQRSWICVWIRSYFVIAAYWVRRSLGRVGPFMGRGRIVDRGCIPAAEDRVAVMLVPAAQLDLMVARTDRERRNTAFPVDAIFGGTQRIARAAEDGLQILPRIIDAEQAGQTGGRDRSGDLPWPSS